MKSFSCIIAALFALLVSTTALAADWICETGETFTFQGARETIRAQGKHASKEEAAKAANGLLKMRLAAFEVAKQAKPDERKNKHRYSVMCSQEGQPADPRVAQLPASTWPKRSGAQAAIKLTWDPWKNNPVKIRLKIDSAYEFGTREWIVVDNKDRAERFECKKALLFKRFFLTSTGRELGGEVFKRVAEKADIRGGKTNADSQIEKALRYAAGNDIHVVKFVGECWGSKKPTEPSGWSDVGEAW